MPDPFAQAAALERTKQLEAAFLILEGEDREILLLRDIEEMSGEQTADLLGLTLTAMKSRLHRARMRLLAAMRRAEAVGPGKSLALSCLEVLQCLPHYADRSLSPEGKIAVERHVAECQACAHFGRRYAELLQALPVLGHGGGTGA
ncbi:MAG: zf-HC2 domain-containing protein [Bryobacterales bacterium]|nr:zf-HC2 domain-containing protein [Bryobacterales bacterium]